jgi:hypothetical protein
MKKKGSAAYWQKRQERFEEGFVKDFEKDFMANLEKERDLIAKESAIVVLQEGYSLAVIIKLTELSVDEIKKLQRTLS